VFALRPIPHHFALWLLLAPLLLVEVYTLDALLRAVALQRPGAAHVAQARVVEQRDGPRGPEVRYAFTAPGHGGEFFARGTLGRGSLWVPISQPAWAAAQASGTIAVRYHPEDPWTNQPVGRVGYPVADSFCLWGLFLLLDVVWLGETLLIIRNFLRAQASAERRTPLRTRFWTVRPVVDARYAPFLPADYQLPAPMGAMQQKGRR
jgi:hypothetical protein